MTLKELREKRARLVAEARSKIDEIKDDTPAERADELESQADAALAECKSLDERIQRMEDLEERETAAREAEERAREQRRPGLGDGSATDPDQRDTPPEYQDVFTRAMRFGEGALDAEERAVLFRNAASPELREQTAGTPAEGGYLIPQGFSGEIERHLAAWGPMLDPEGGARMIPTDTGNALPWPTLDDTASRGELKTEGAASTDDGSGDLTFGQKLMNAYVYDSKIVKVSIELLQDSAFSMEGLIEEAFGERLGRTVNDVLTVGDGSAKPNGIVNAAGAGHVAASATAIASDELLDLVHSIDPAYRGSPNVQFMFNDVTLLALRKLKDGDGNYLWQQGDIRAGEPNTLWGYRYRINQAMADAAASTVPIVFGDFRRYAVRRVRNTQMVTFREKFMHERKIGFMAFMRVDGELLNADAVKKLTMAAV